MIIKLVRAGTKEEFIEKENAEKNTAFYVATFSEQIQVGEVLLNSGANPMANFPETVQYAPLHIAALGIFSKLNFYKNNFKKKLMLFKKNNYLKF